MDADWRIELGINPDGDLYFYPAQAPKNNYNLIKNPLKSNEWNHIIVTWNFETKKVNFYINGEERKNNIENVPKYWKEPAKTEAKEWYLGGTALNIESTFTGDISELRTYNKSLNKEEVKWAYQFNRKELRHPKISFGEEELISVEKTTGDIFDPLSVKDIKTIDKIKVNIY